MSLKLPSPDKLVILCDATNHAAGCFFFLIDEHVDQSVEQKFAPVTICSEKCLEFECL